MSRRGDVPGRYLIPAQLVRGYCMGAADVVPGVSGGTVALVFGIYERLVHNIRSGAGVLARVATGDLRGAAVRLRRIEWTFILPLLAGIGAAVATLARVIEHQLEVRPAEMAGLFFGLVAASIVVAWDHLRRRDGRRVAVMAVTALITFVALGFRGAPVTDPAWWVWPASGAVAVCAMILPGISGSFLLLMLGTYDAVLGAVNDRDVVSVGLFGLGAVGGLAVFSVVLDWALRRHHDTVVAALIGLMAGSLRVLWPWPDGTATGAVSLPDASGWWQPVAAGVVGAVVVLGVAGLARRAPARAGIR